jgi:hypothetical protein
MAGVMAQVVEHLLSMIIALNQTPVLPKKNIKQNKTKNKKRDSKL